MKGKKKLELDAPAFLSVRRGKVDVFVVGTSPFIYNAVSEKTRQELLFPRRRRTDADRAELGPKHDPLREYRDSCYAHMGHDRATRLMCPVGAFKKAMETAALDMPGVTKARIVRQVWIDERDVDMYGTPQIYMAIVRNSDINRTPDVRTRAVLPEWACRFSVGYAEPLVKPEWISMLLAAAGIYCGIGDGRQEKGHGHGQFELVQPNDKRYLAIIKAGGRVPQDNALRTPEPYDLETARLLSWWLEESKRPSARVAVEISDKPAKPRLRANGKVEVVAETAEPAKSKRRGKLSRVEAA